jgi:predicted enzyme related to lactoylglutathione lyase
MPERSGYLQGVPCWVDTSQPQPDAVLDFYRGLFGWEFENVMPPDSPGQYFLARIGGRDVAGVGSIPPEAPPTAVWNTYIAVESADDAVAKAKDAGGQVLMEPFDIMESGRMGFVADPEGAALCVWQANQHMGASLVNEHGALNFNTLNTRDVAGAKAFYGALFGWSTLDMGGGVEMWTLPGYGDYLARDNPGLREMMAEMGAVPGFEDVVAAILPIPAGQPDTPPHWSVTFGTDDVDATAETAASLGGQVVVPPFNAPWVRTAVLADPKGATFVASQFVPENKDVG